MIMKKEYIAPQLFEMIVETGHILAGSGEIKQSGSQEQATVTPSQETYGGKDWASRRSSVWDDDEDEDF